MFALIAAGVLGFLPLPSSAANASDLRAALTEGMRRDCLAGLKGGDFGREVCACTANGRMKAVSDSDLARLTKGSEASIRSMMPTLSRSGESIFNSCLKSVGYRQCLAASGDEAPDAARAYCDCLSSRYRPETARSNAKVDQKFCRERALAR